MDTKLVIDFLTKLGEQISTTGKQVFEVYTKQSYINGIVELVLGVVFIITTGLLVKGALWAYREDEEGWLFGFNILNFISIMLMIFCLTHGIKSIINPQYYAIQDLVMSLKP